MNRHRVMLVAEVLLVVVFVCVVGVVIQPAGLRGEVLGMAPVPRFVDEGGALVLRAEWIVRGQVLSEGMVGDGAAAFEHPDTLSEMKEKMGAYYAKQRGVAADTAAVAIREASIKKRVGLEVGFNRYDPVIETVTLTESQVAAFEGFVAGLTMGERVGDMRDLGAYRFWCGWMRGVDGPEYDTGYRVLGSELVGESGGGVRGVGGGGGRGGGGGEGLLGVMLGLIGLATVLGVVRSLLDGEETRGLIA